MVMMKVICRKNLIETHFSGMSTWMRKKSRAKLVFCNRCTACLRNESNEKSYSVYYEACKCDGESGEVSPVF